MVAIVDTLMREIAPHDIDKAAEVAAFVSASLTAMPDTLGPAFRLLTVAFDVESVLFNGRAFHRCDAHHRTAHIARWTRSRFGFRRALMSFYRSFVTFGIYSQRHETVATSIGCCRSVPARLPDAVHC